MTNLYVIRVRSSIPPRWDKCAQNDLSPTKNGTVSLFYLRTFHKSYALVPHNIAALPRHKAATWRYLIKKYINKSKPHTKRESAYSIQQRQRKQAWQPKKCVFHNRVFFIFNWSLKIWIWKKKKLYIFYVIFLCFNSGPNIVELTLSGYHILYLTDAPYRFDEINTSLLFTPHFEFIHLNWSSFYSTAHIFFYTSCKQSFKKNTQKKNIYTVLYSYSTKMLNIIIETYHFISRPPIVIFYFFFLDIIRHMDHLMD